MELLVGMGINRAPGEAVDWVARVARTRLQTWLAAEVEGHVEMEAKAAQTLVRITNSTAPMAEQAAEPFLGERTEA